MNNNPKRLIEVDLPIRRISAFSRWEKKSVTGHIKQMHLWWARRPLAACRAVLCAALWPDPEDDKCPKIFLQIAQKEMRNWAINNLSKSSTETFPRFSKLAHNPDDINDKVILRHALLDFIGDFSDWANSSLPEYLATCRALTQAAHESLGGARGTRPLVVDPFAGGGSIPVEAVRIGADTFASDMNPVAVLLNKVALEYIPKYGQGLADEVRRWGRWIQQEAEQQLSGFYPKDADGSIPIAYLWARTIQCEGPTCGVEVPLIKGFWLTKKSSRPVGFRLVKNLALRKIDFEILDDPKAVDLGSPTVKRGSATCPFCGFTTPVSSVRRQLKAKRGGANEARLFCVARVYPGKKGRFYRLASENDLKVVDQAKKSLLSKKNAHRSELSLIPTEPTPLGGGSGAGRAFSQRNYGMDAFEDLFTSRQSLALCTFSALINNAKTHFGEIKDQEFITAIETVLALNLTKLVDLCTSLGAWEPNIPTVQHLFGRQAIGMCWDFAEGVPIGQGRGSWINYLEKMADILSLQSGQWAAGHAEQQDASNHPLPDDSAQVFFTDPPYYDAVPYADLSDIFYVWLRRALQGRHEGLFNSALTPKKEECIVDEVKGKDSAYFERTMRLAMDHGRRILEPCGIGIVVFAHKSTAGWEAQLQAMIDAGWVITGSWPIDTENASRLRAQGSAVLASSVHIICRPRESSNGELRTDEIGDWREVLAKLPGRIHEWMPRLNQEGVVGADAIFACLGPALEIFSKYSRVEKASGEQVKLSEYLIQVWAAVSREALALVLKGGDTAGFEEDARLTAMWLWTLQSGGEEGESSGDETEEENDDTGERKSVKMKGFCLEFDAARKIGQGLGCHLERLGSLVEIKGPVARLLSIDERAQCLWKVDKASLPKVEVAPKRDRKAKGDAPGQMSLFELVPGDKPAPTPEVEAVLKKVELKAGLTTLDRLHQAMLLFGAGRGEALKRFLVDDGVGKDERIWKLASALQPLYPMGTDERRWSEGVLARKKGLGF